MTKLLTILVLFFCGKVFSQAYRFDIVSTYESTTEKGKDYDIVLSNSNDQTYFLKVFHNAAYLYDVKRRLRHDFKIINGNPSKPELRYKKSIRLEKSNVASDYIFKFETIKEDSLHKTIKMTAWKNNQIKTPEYIELTAKKISKNLFPLYRFSCMHLFETRPDVDILENIVILSSKTVGNNTQNWLLISVDETEATVY